MPLPKLDSFPTPTVPPWAAGLPGRARRTVRVSWIAWCLAWCAFWVIVSPLAWQTLILALLSLAAIFIGRPRP